MRLRAGNEYQDGTSGYGNWQERRTLPDCLGYAIQLVFCGKYTITRNDVAQISFRRPYIWDIVELYEFEGTADEVTKLRELVNLWESIRDGVLSGSMDRIVGEAMLSKMIPVQTALGQFALDNIVEGNLGPMLLAVMGASDEEITQLGPLCARVKDAATIAEWVLAGDLASFGAASQMFAS